MAGPRAEVAALALPPGIRNKLLCAGFRTAGDLEGIGPVDLAAGEGLAKEAGALISWVPAGTAWLAAAWPRPPGHARPEPCTQRRN